MFWKYLCLVVLALGAESACAGDERREPSRCERYADHAIELRFSGLEGELAARHASNLRETRRGALIEQCRAASDTQVACALDAADYATLRGCSKTALNRPGRR